MQLSLSLCVQPLWFVNGLICTKIKKERFIPKLVFYTIILITFCALKMRCVRHMYVTYMYVNFIMSTDHNPSFQNADTHKSRSIIVSAFSLPHFTLILPRGCIKMNSETKFSDFSSDASTEILPDNTLPSHKTNIHNKISIIKDNMKIELESKGSLPPSGNILCFSAVNKPWLDIVEKLCSK